MIRMRALRELFSARIQESMQHGTDMAGYRQGALAFVQEFHEMMGVSFDPRTGRPGFLVGENGQAYKAPGSARASEISLRYLAEALHGHEMVEEIYHPMAGLDFGNRALLEAAIDPTAFLNINTFNLSVAGLINAQIMERFTAPEYVMTSLVEVKGINQNGYKRIGVAKISPQTKAAKGRQPGEPHAEVGFTEMYQNTPVTVEEALKVPVTREAVYFDITGQVIETSGEVGDELAYGREKDITDTIIGVTGLASEYNFNGNSYETYQTSSPFVNDQVNVFADITSVDAARQLFVGMTDPVTGREIQINSLDILCLPFQELKFRTQLFGPDIQLGSQNAVGSNFYPLQKTMSPNRLNEVGRGTYRLIPATAITRNRMTAADGLNLTGSIADQYWWVGDFQRALMWQESWPLTPWSASADELTMKDRGLIAVYGANYRGSMFVKEPRYIVRNKPQ